MNPKHLTPADTLARAREMRHQPTSAEQKLWFALRDRRLGGFKFRRQRPIPPFIADFHCVEARLIIEIDGDSHAVQTTYDRERTMKIERDGNLVLRFTNWDVFERFDAVLRVILAECERRSGRLAK